MIKGINDDALARELEKEFAEEDKKIDEEEAKNRDFSPTTAGRSARISSAALKSALQKKKNEVIKNSTSNNDLVLIKNTTSLLYRFESCGFNYQKQMNLKNITYRDIEKVLILFRNSYSVDR